jgi:aminoglycoside phosphotransferase (APT) family kinase protein
MRHVPPQRGATDLPVLTQALASDRMLESFRRFLPPRGAAVWARCEVERVSFKPGKSSRVLYRLWKEAEPLAAGRPHYFYCEFLPATRSLRRYLDLKERGKSVPPTGFVAELDMIYWEFPADPRLSQLESVWREGTWRVVTYTPTMSCVLAGQSGREPTIVKLYHDDRVDRVAQVMTVLLRAGVAAPRVLHVDAARRLVVLEHVPGISFWSDPPAHLQREVMIAMARQLAKLHDTHLDTVTLASLEPVRFGEREWSRFGEACTDLGAAFPDLQPRLERLTRMLVDAHREPEGTLLHGDFHPAQFLVEHGVPRLIDFDNVCLGDPMYDLARFASHLYYKGIVYGRPLPEIEATVSAFRSGYIAAGTRFDPNRWFWQLAVSLVAKRAHRVMTRLELEAAASVSKLVTIAEQNAASILQA